MRHPRRTMLKRTILALLSLVGLGVVSVALLFQTCALLEVTPVVTYATRENAKEPIAKGWLPPYLPLAARNISERHDMDSNRVCAVFELDKASQSEFSEVLDDLGFAAAEPGVEIPRRLRSRPCPGAIPVDTQIQILRRKVRVQVYDFESFRFENFALSRSSELVFYWTN